MFLFKCFFFFLFLIHFPSPHHSLSFYLYLLLFNLFFYFHHYCPLFPVSVILSERGGFFSCIITQMERKMIFFWRKNFVKRKMIPLKIILSILHHASSWKREQVSTFLTACLLYNDQLTKVIEKTQTNHFHQHNIDHMVGKWYVHIDWSLNLFW